MRQHGAITMFIMVMPVAVCGGWGWGGGSQWCDSAQKGNHMRPLATTAIAWSGLNGLFQKLHWLVGLGVGLGGHVECQCTVRVKYCALIINFGVWLKHGGRKLYFLPPCWSRCSINFELPIRRCGMFTFLRCGLDPKIINCTDCRRVLIVLSFYLWVLLNTVNTPSTHLVTSTHCQHLQYTF